MVFNVSKSPEASKPSRSQSETDDAKSYILLCNDSNQLWPSSLHSCNEVHSVTCPVVGYQLKKHSTASRANNPYLQTD